MKLYVYNCDNDGDTEHTKFLLSYSMKINTEFNLATYLAHNDSNSQIYILQNFNFCNTII